MRCAPPDAPSKVQASDCTYPDRVRVTWSSVAGAAYYHIYRAIWPAGVSTKIAEPTAASYDDTSVVSGRYYNYKVKACNAGGGCSGFSKTARGRCCASGERYYAYLPIVMRGHRTR